MDTAGMRHKHLKLDQRKIDTARRILGVKTETETIEMALDMVIHKDRAAEEKKKVVRRILGRRERLKASSKEIAGWIREGRRAREKDYE